MIWGYSGGFVGRVGEIRARNGRKVVGKVALVESEAIEALALCRAGYNENVACKLESRKAGLAARVELLVPDYYYEEEAPLASPQSTVAPPFVFRGRQFLFHRPHLRKSTFAAAAASVSFHSRTEIMFFDNSTYS